MKNIYQHTKGGKVFMQIGDFTIVTGKSKETKLNKQIMAKIKDLDKDKLVELDICHPDDIEEVLECIENDCIDMMRLDLFMKLSVAGYNMDNN